MNMTMQQPLPYRFYMDKPRLPLAMPWSSNSFHSPSPHQQQFHSLYSIPQSLSPFILPQQQYPLSKKIPSSASCSNIRYHHLKQSASYSSRRPVHRSYDASTRPHRHSTYNDVIPTHQNRPSKTKSISDLQQISQFSSTPLPKSHSWHTTTNHRRSNLSVAYAKEMELTPKPRRKHSPQKKKKIHHHHQRQLTSSPKRQPSFNNHRKRSVQIPKRGVVRISTLDELPIVNDQTHLRKNSISNDRLSMKGSISNSTKHQKRPKEKSKENISIKNRKNQRNDDVDEGARMDSDIQSSSSSSSNYSRLSLQRRLNGSLRNDPLIIAAMEDYRQLRRSFSQTTSLTRHRQDLSRDSLCSDSTFHSPLSSPSPSISRSNSQSSFTSVERSEIRQLIKTIKTKDKKKSNISLQASRSPSEQSISTKSPPLVPMIKPKKSCVTEELDRKFNKLRAHDPNQELTYVTPSSICKRKKTNEKPAQTIPPLPTFDELLRQVQLRPIDKSIKPICFKEKPIDDVYENPLSSIPVPQSSPIPTDEIKIEEVKHEYAIPIKKTEQRSRPQICYFQPMRNFKNNKSLSNNVPEKRASRSLSILNWFHNDLTNPLPTTFQPNRIINNNQNEYETTNVKENIYTSDIDVYLPSSTIDKNDDHSLQIHLDNQTIRTDDFYSDYQTTKQTTNSSSILNDFSHLFTRKHKHQNKLNKKHQSCSIM